MLQHTLAIDNILNVVLYSESILFKNLQVGTVKPLVKLFLTFTILGIIVWLGGSVIRNAIAYDIFIPGTLIQKPSLDAISVNNTIRLYSLTAFYTITGYALVCIGMLFLLFQNISMLKKKGWLFMIVALFILAIPAEVYLILFDIELVKTLQSSADNYTINTRLSDTFFRKFSSDSFASQASALTMMAYITSLILFAFRPLDKTDGNVSSDDLKAVDNIH